MRKWSFRDFASGYYVYGVPVRIYSRWVISCFATSRLRSSFERAVEPTSTSFTVAFFRCSGWRRHLPAKRRPARRAQSHLDRGDLLQGRVVHPRNRDTFFLFFKFLFFFSFYLFRPPPHSLSLCSSFSLLFCSRFFAANKTANVSRMGNGSSIFARIFTELDLAVSGMVKQKCEKKGKNR